MDLWGGALGGLDSVDGEHPQRLPEEVGAPAGPSDCAAGGRAPPAHLLGVAANRAGGARGPVGCPRAPVLLLRCPDLGRRPSWAGGRGAHQPRLQSGGRAPQGDVRQPAGVPAFDLAALGEARGKWPTGWPLTHALPVGLATSFSIYNTSHHKNTSLAKLRTPKKKQSREQDSKAKEGKHA